MADTVLSWVVTLGPFVFSFVIAWRASHMMTHRGWQLGVIAVGLVITLLTGWQQSRSNSAHQAEVNRLNNGMTHLDSNVDVLRKEMVDVVREQQLAIGRQQQAEHDLAIVSAADQKNKPMTKAVVGPVINQQKMDSLAAFINSGNKVKMSPPKVSATPDVINGWLKSVQEWWNGVDAFLRKNCNSQAVVVASDLSRMVGMSFGGINQDERVQNTFNSLDRLIGNLTELVKHPELCQ